MNPADPNIGSVEIVAAALGELCEELVLVGGCAVSLLIDAASAPPARVTYDVDLIAVVTALSDYHRLERRVEERGFGESLRPAQRSGDPADSGARIRSDQIRGLSSPRAIRRSGES